MDLTKFKHAFGKPGEGLHSYRLPGDIALVDTGLTVLAAISITYLSSKTKRYIPISYSMVGLFSAGIIAHKLVGLKEVD